MAHDFDSLHEANLCRFYGRGGDTLFVWFGGINEPFFSETFAKRCGFDCLYVRDQGFDWYTQGLHGSGLSRDAFAHLLKDAGARYKFVVFCGQSSGGYASLYYGLTAGAHLCIVFSPQTRNFYTGQNAMVPHVKLQNLGRLYKDAERRPRVVINVSRSEADHEEEFEWQDHRQIELLRAAPGVTTIIHDYNNHSVSVTLRNDGLLYKYVYALVQIYNRDVAFEDMT